MPAWGTKGHCVDFGDISEWNCCAGSATTVVRCIEKAQVAGGILDPTNPYGRKCIVSCAHCGHF
jgi:hypothetical protein